MAAGDPAYWSDVANLVNRPVTRLVQQAVQSISNNTLTALTFGAGSEEIDTHGFHDTATNTSRVTPSVAGYYRVRGLYFSITGADYTLLEASVGKNGAAMAGCGRRVPPLITGAQSIEAGAIVSCNGSTDYIELLVLQTNSGATAKNTNVSSRFVSTLEVEYVRPL